MKKYKINYIILILLVFILTLTGCEYDTGLDSIDYDDGLVVHFIDVGQGDSTLIEFPNGKISLIDGGTRNSGDKVVKYLKDLGVDKIDYLIATHPHEDHIGGLPKVIRNFSIDKVYMPDRTATTKIFEEVLREIKNKDLKISIAKGRDIIMEEEGLKYWILAPNRDDYSETNDFSIVTKIEYKKNSFIFMGDAEKESELDIIENNYNIKSQVLRVGHHGSRTSSTEEFLEKVNPDYSVISLGRDNSYGHPHKETMDGLNKIDTTVLRTDELGDIVIVSDGKEIKVLEDYIASPENATIKYVGNKNTKIYHRKECGSLPKEENQIIFNTREEAESNGFNPHEKCIKQGEKN